MLCLVSASIRILQSKGIINDLWPTNCSIIRQPSFQQIQFATLIYRTVYQASMNLLVTPSRNTVYDRLAWDHVDKKKQEKVFLKLDKTLDNIFRSSIRTFSVSRSEFDSILSIHLQHIWDHYFLELTDNVSWTEKTKKAKNKKQKQNSENVKKIQKVLL